MEGSGTVRTAMKVALCNTRAFNKVSDNSRGLEQRNTFLKPKLLATLAKSHLGAIVGWPPTD